MILLGIERQAEFRLFKMPTFLHFSSINRVRCNERGEQLSTSRVEFEKQEVHKRQKHYKTHLLTGISPAFSHIYK